MPLARADPGLLGLIDAEGLRRMIAEQIEQAVSEVIWSGTPAPSSSPSTTCGRSTTPALYPERCGCSDADINTQMVLLEAARIFDERNRDMRLRRRRRGAPRGGRREPAEAGDSTDPTMLDEAPPAAAFALALPDEIDLREAAPTHAAERAAPADQSPWTSCSPSSSPTPFTTRWRGRSWSRSTRPASQPRAAADRAGRSEAAASPWRRRRRSGARARAPRSSPWSRPARGNSPRGVYREETGVACWRSPAKDVEAVVACVENVIESRRDLVRGAPRPDTKSGVARLRAGVRRPALGVDLGGDGGAEPSCRTSSRSRSSAPCSSWSSAVHLVALGAFGNGSQRPAARRGDARASRSHAEPSATPSPTASTPARCRDISFESAELPEPFRSMVDHPPRKSCQVVIFPCCWRLAGGDLGDLHRQWRPRRADRRHRHPGAGDRPGRHGLRKRAAAPPDLAGKIERALRAAVWPGSGAGGGS